MIRYVIRTNESGREDLWRIVPSTYPVEQYGKGELAVCNAPRGVVDRDEVIAELDWLCRRIEDLENRP